MRPLLKWAGGKSKLAPKIARALGERCAGTYYEPFLGSGSVFLHLMEKGLIRKSSLWEINPDLVHFHVAIRDNPHQTIEALEDLPQEDWKEQYLAIRSEFNARRGEKGPEQAARLLWINKTCFNGLFRENKSGLFNVPIGSYVIPALPDKEHILAVSRLLQDAEIQQGSFVQSMGHPQSGDWVYCDPPYVPLSETSNFTSYASNGFGSTEQLLLRDLAAFLGNTGVHVVLSNHDVPFVTDELYGDRHIFSVEALTVRRSISSGKRKVAGEVIIRTPL